MPNVYTLCQWGPAAPMRRSKLTVERRAELARRRRAGEDVAALAVAFGITPRQVYRVIADEKGDTRGRVGASKPVAFRAPVAEVEAFVQSARSVGITGSSQAFRALVRMATGLFELFPNQLEDFNRSVWLIGKEGQLLNQLAKNVHRGKLRLTERDRALLSKCIDVNLRLHSDLRAILDEAKTRRGYAVSLLSKQSGSEKVKEQADG
jgi:hypothetical protein